MRVHATATQSSTANAVGRVELECTPAGLAIGLHLVAAYADGYLPVGTTSGTRVLLPYSALASAVVEGDRLHMKFSAPGFPHDRLSLTRFTPGPGVPPAELRRRRLILHLSTLGTLGIMALLLASLLPNTRGAVSAGVLAIAAATAGLVLAVGFSLDQRFFLRPPGEEATRAAFIADLKLHYPALVESGAKIERPAPVPWKEWATLLPRSAFWIGGAFTALVLTALVGTQELRRAEFAQTAREEADFTEASSEPQLNERPSTAAVRPEPSAPAESETKEDDATSRPPAHTDGLRVERTCVCDRADSPLWHDPVPRLSALLLETRTVPRKTHVRTQVDVAVVNNGDEPLKDITLHVVFWEGRKGNAESGKERPLYYEGPLRPGEAVKWTAEARGDGFRVLAPDLGQLGANAEGAASREAFKELLKANHRPVRLHAARMLSFLGDPSAHEAALNLKDAFRSREAPYLRRVLAATGNLKICDIERPATQPAAELGACVFNGSGEPQADLGIVVEELAERIDPSQPLANPPELISEHKFRLGSKVPADSGVFVRLPFPGGILRDKKNEVEIMTDQYDLLE